MFEGTTKKEIAVIAAVSSVCTLIAERVGKKIVKWLGKPEAPSFPTQVQPQQTGNKAVNS